MGRPVRITILFPEGGQASQHRLPVLIFQDGQDFPALRIADTFRQLLSESKIEPALMVGVHANEDRIHEYGIAKQADYKGRGARAGQYTRFVCEELLPYLKANFNVRNERYALAGFSLGGLMALDIAWNHADCFSKVGVFSGSLWWRRKAYSEGYIDRDRIMHLQIAESNQKPDLKFWFQTGTEDETSDRDGDGIIDSIGDTLDCIALLERKGYSWGKDIRYLEIKGGKHHPDTWGIALYDFIGWALSSSI